MPNTALSSTSPSLLELKSIYLQPYAKPQPAQVGDNHRVSDRVSVDQVEISRSARIAAANAVNPAITQATPSIQKDVTLELAQVAFVTGTAATGTATNAANPEFSFDVAAANQISSAFAPPTTSATYTIPRQYLGLRLNELQGQASNTATDIYVNQQDTSIYQPYGKIYNPSKPALAPELTGEIGQGLDLLV